MAKWSHTSSSSKSRTTARIPVISNEHINAFTGEAISNYSGAISNGIVDAYSNEPERTYVTNRPAITVTDDASAIQNPSNDSGRGVYHWGIRGDTFIVNNNTVYINDYTSTCNVYGNGTGLLAGTERVYFQEWSSPFESYLFIINPEGNQIFCIRNTDSANQIINLKDSVNQTGAIGEAPFDLETGGDGGWDFGWLPQYQNDVLCHGSVSLDSYLFLGCKSGNIYNSKVDNWLKGDSTYNVVSAERDTDKLLYIEKTKDHIAAFGEQSIELFYDAGNESPSSPLGNREDIAYRTGILNGQCGWADGDVIHFIGIKPSGDIALYTLNDFNLNERVNTTLSSYFRESRRDGNVSSNLDIAISGFSAGGHTYCVITLYQGGTSNPLRSIVYDTYTDKWYEWSTSILGIQQFPLIDWSIRTPENPVIAQGIMRNGDVFKVSTDLEPVDKAELGNYYFLEDYMEDTGVAATDYMVGYVEYIASNNIAMQVLIDAFDGLSAEDKFMHSLEYIGNATPSDQILHVEWSDDDGVTWRSSDLNIKKRYQINRMGSFKRRRFRMSYSGNDTVRIEAIDVTFTQGG